MKVTLSLENTISDDVSIMVDVLRASTTITAGLNNFEKIIPCFSPEEAFKLKQIHNGVIAGERGGARIEGFEMGNSPEQVEKFESDKKTLILTTSNGTRILENMKSKVLIGCMINAKAVALKSLKLATSHIDIVMAGVKGEFAIEDFLAAGEILFWISQNCQCELSEFAQSAVLASRNYDMLKKAILNSSSGKRLIKLNYEDDIQYCMQKNTSENVAIYIDNELSLYI